MFEFSITNHFVKDFKMLEPAIRKQVEEKLRVVRNSENPLFFAKKLKGHKNVFRFRSGDYRIVFRAEKVKIILLKVKHRKDIYENL